MTTGAAAIEELFQTTQRIFGPAHPLTKKIEDDLDDAYYTRNFAVVAAEASTASEEEESEDEDSEEEGESEASFESTTNN